jgi:hypothetical protein
LSIGRLWALDIGGGRAFQDVAVSVTVDAGWTA